ncbi:MAG: MarR family transcriptional regulator [Myxococcales bacterium]|nr:MAG: MarR family transcriptional regulator [Myxococcales bacterium]
MSQVPATDRLFRSLIDFNRTVRSQSVATWTGGAEHGLSRNEVVVLGLLVDHDSCRASTIADRMNVGASVISRLVSGLTSRGLITRESDPDDGRAERLHVTEPGRVAVQAARNEFIAALTRQLSDWDDDRIHSAAEVLEDLAVALRSTPEEKR